MSTHAARRASAGTGQHHGSAGRRLDARAPAISVSEARHIQGSERPGGLTRTHCGGGRRCGANDLVPNGVATGATVRLARTTLINFVVVVFNVLFILSHICTYKSVIYELKQEQKTRSTISTRCPIACIRACY